MAHRPSAILHLLPRMGNGADGAAAPPAAQPDQWGDRRAAPLRQPCRPEPGDQVALWLWLPPSHDAERIRARAARDAPADDARAHRVRHDPAVARRLAGAGHIAITAPPPSRRAAVPDARGRHSRLARLAAPQNLASGVGPADDRARDGGRTGVHAPVQVVWERLGGAAAAGGGGEADRLFAQDDVVQGFHLA